MTHEMRDHPRDDARMREVEIAVEEVVVVRKRRSPVDRRDLLEAVVPEATGEPHSTTRPNFARGQEEDPARLERFVEDRFSRGQEDDPTLHQQVHEGDFATGQAPTPRHPEVELHGRFARGQQLSDEGNPNQG
ncbi:MAG TPA: hypothetical protein VF029_00285 [Actinomycetota bacterium]